MIDGLTSEELEQENMQLTRMVLDQDTVEGNNLVETFEKVYHSNGEVTSSSFTVSTTHGLHRAFCIQFGKKAPAVGEYGHDLKLSENRLLRKVLYYGYNGVEPIKEMDRDFFVETATAASMANGWEMKESATALATVFMEDVEKLDDPPVEFQVWTMGTNGGETQDLAYWIWSLEVQDPIVPIMISEAVDAKTGTHFGVLEDRTNLNDTVSISGLIEGEQYVLHGYLVDRSTGEEIYVGGNQIESRVEFIADTVELEVLNTFSFEGSGLDEIEIVVFEFLYNEAGDLIALDMNIDNEAQTVLYESSEEVYEYIEEKDEIVDNENEDNEGEIVVQEVEPDVVDRPKTGDESTALKYIILSALAFVGVCLAQRNKSIYKMLNEYKQ